LVHFDSLKRDPSTEKPAPIHGFTSSNHSRGDIFVKGAFCISPRKGSIQDHAAKAANGSDPDFSQFPNNSSTLTGRKPMRVEEADRLCNACKTAGEKFVLWTLLDTGLRVFELRCAD
jgi:hypothetical protein